MNNTVMISMCGLAYMDTYMLKNTADSELLLVWGALLTISVMVFILAARLELNK